MRQIIIPYRGDIFSVSDSPENPIVKYPSDSLPKGQKKRTYHKKRYVLIQSKITKFYQNRTILIIPLSSKGRDTEYTKVIPTEYLANHIPDDSVAQVHLIQPILVDFLIEKCGKIPTNSQTFKDIENMLLRLIGKI